ncbi:ubiquinol oxidase subunit II [Sphingomonas sp.]|jgi:cytochrome o ubiquinol oxidase subunit 2|uniref:ubiquinol oxidase subunit II n=1 Tax=Sphingomonas sp. TaxID=28214 RepID=UPI0026104E03|nr:ubiquinol oxidase subunit II [Sphingomonas sp.]MDF2495607.1 ubiquinol oxidase subunit [Sphingomonas sp.]
MPDHPAPAPRLARLALLPLLLFVAGCQGAVLDPAGDVALQERNLIYASVGLMLLIIVPVMILTVVFAWRYRKGNKDATYDPHFDHSTSLELVIWSAPLLIIIALGAITWSSTHLLDPFRPLNRISATQPKPKNERPMLVQVVSLDWKWLFIYPELGIATVNELALPVNREVRFDMTSSNMMNTFYAPTLAGMVYTMPGMRSTLHAVLNRPGEYEGMSANYSGAGFSYMRFKLLGQDNAGFDRWVAEVKARGNTLDTANYLKLEKPSEKVPPMFFSNVQPALFQRIYERCVTPGTPCMSEIMARDAALRGAKPHEMRPGAGVPAGRTSIPREKPEGALLKDSEEIEPAPHLSKPPLPGAPGATKPDSPRNRDMSFLLLPTVPGLTGAARG